MATVRRSIDRDRPAIRDIHRSAFPSRIEADVVDRLFDDEDVALSLIAEEGSDAVGHILLSRMTAEVDGEPLKALALAPVSVLPKYQGTGIGSQLIRAAIAEARAAGEDLIFVLGEPSYYGRFGFSAGCAAAFENAYSGPYFQALWLNDRGSRAGEGSALHAPAFADLE